MLRAHYPWGQETTAPRAAIEVLYDYARNQMAHSVGLGLGTAPDYGYAKPRLTPSATRGAGNCPAAASMGTANRVPG
jgi:hypothetical protein